MKRFFRQIAAVLAAAALALSLPGARAAGSGEELVRVGLAYGTGALASANLENNTGYGSGYRFGYFDSDLDFVELGRTEAGQTQITMLKAQNYWQSGSGYTTSDNGRTAIGCYHVALPDSVSDYEDAADLAGAYDGGFVAWIDGTYQVRVGAYPTKSEAQAACDALGKGSVAGTSSYGVNVVATGTADILFQFDGGSSRALGVLPDVTGEDAVRTWFKGNRYYGGFRYERVGGGDLTVVNIVELETYIKGVIPYEMSNDWPLEALKAQAVCARSYAYNNIKSAKHSGSHFDVCNTTDCQVYYGAGTNSASYQANDRTDRAVEETAGEYAWYNGSVIEAFYSSSHGGASEDVYNVWGSSRSKYPYLCGVTDPYEADMNSRNSYSSWSVSYTAAGLADRLGDSQGSGGIDSLVLTYSDLGNVIRLQVNYGNGHSKTYQPESIRSKFSVKSIRFTVNGQSASSGTSTGTGSSGGLTVNGGGGLSGDRVSVISGSGTIASLDRGDLYTISGSGTIAPAEGGSQETGGEATPSGTQVTVTGSSFRFQGSGNGHQLGMSQYGAYAMVERGFTYDEVIEFYFPGVTVR